MTNALTAFLLAGLGGLLPTLAKIGASFAAQPDQPLPSWHIVVALVIFFIIGSCLNIPFNKANDFAKAVVVGIAAPALITNIIAGVASAPVTNPLQTEIRSNSLKESPGVQATAPEPPKPNGPPGQNANPTANENIQIDINTVLGGEYGYPGVTLPLVVSYTLADGQTKSAGTLSPGANMSFIVPGSAKSVALNAPGAASAVAQIPPNAQTVNIRAQIDITPKNDLLWALGAKRDGVVKDISLSLTAVPKH